MNSPTFRGAFGTKQRTGWETTRDGQVTPRFGELYPGPKGIEYKHRAKARTSPRPFVASLRRLIKYFNKARLLASGALVISAILYR